MIKNRTIKIALSLSVIVLTGLGVLAYNANTILKHELRKFLGQGFSVGDISLSWSGVEAENIRLVRHDNKEAFSVEDLTLRMNLFGLLKRENLISNITLDTPHLLIEIDNHGEIIFPWPSLTINQGKPFGTPGAPYVIKKFRVEEGALDYLDRKVSATPVLIQLKEIEATFRNLPIPPDDRVSSFNLKAALTGRTKKGSISSVGALNPVTKDTKAQLSIRDMDITLLRPYYEKKGDVEVTQGLLSLDAEFTIKNNKINAVGKITLAELLFRQSGKNIFLGLPLSAVMKLLKDNNNQIALDFTIEGDLNNPKFRITENLVQKLSLSLAKSLGMPIEAIGKSVLSVGGSALKKIFK